MDQKESEIFFIIVEIWFVFKAHTKGTSGEGKKKKKRVNGYNNKEIQNTGAKDNLSPFRMSSGQCFSNASNTQAPSLCSPFGKLSLPQVPKKAIAPNSSM